jgi:hypothetical protein
METVEQFVGVYMLADREIRIDAQTPVADLLLVIKKLSEHIHSLQAERRQISASEKRE